jgi:signal transduction histidine kinase
MTEDLEEAFDGEVAADFDDLNDEEDAEERESGVPLIEIYSPIRESGTGRIIAVAEFYENGEELGKTLENAIIESWLIISAASVAMFLMLFGVVYRASRTIREQQESLRGRLVQNEVLREGLQKSSQRVTEINEQILRQLGADLHDGPAQMLAYAALRLDSLTGKVEDEVISRIRSSLNDALSDIRHICRGLSLPELDGLSPRETLTSAIISHVNRTDTQLKADLSQTPATLPKSHKIAIFRFVQEALNNAYKHAGSKDVKIDTACRDGKFTVTVSDQGPGFDSKSRKTSGVAAGMGLTGLRDRFESLGGSVTIDRQPGSGTRLSATLLFEEKTT